MGIALVRLEEAVMLGRLAAYGARRCDCQGVSDRGLPTVGCRFHQLLSKRILFFSSEWRQKARSAKVPLQQRSDPCFLMTIKDKDLNFVHLPNHSSVAPL